MKKKITLMDQISFSKIQTPLFYQVDIPFVIAQLSSYLKMHVEEKKKKLATK